MPSLLGTAPNQVSVNSDLGKLAFMDVVDTVTNNPYLDTAISDTKPSLLLDFANSKTLDPRVTFSRASTGAYYDGTSSAVAEQNLVTYSEQFDNSGWTKTTTTVTANSLAAPDGNTTADTLTASGSNSTVLQTYTATAVAYTFSVWIYRKTGTGNIDITVDGTTWVTQSVTSGWTRFSTTLTPAAGSKTAGVRIATSGDEVYLWGAQLEQRSSVTAYTPTTSSAITNYIPVLKQASAGVPRFDHNPVTGESLGFLIEEQRTNLCTYSSDFSNATWSKSNCSITTAATVAPDGTLTAQKIVENTATSSIHKVQNYSVTSKSAGEYTFSVYLKPAGRSELFIEVFPDTPNDFNNDASGTFNLTTKTAFGLTRATASIVDVGNGWVKCILTSTQLNSSTSPRLTVLLQTSVAGSTTYTGDGYSGVYIWGAQLEAGSFATSYIPTVASQVTRSADSASVTGTNFSPWYNQAEGTLYAETQTLPNNAAGAYFVAVGNYLSTSNYILLRRLSTGMEMRTQINGIGVGAGLTALPYTAGALNKVVGAYKTNDSAYVSNSGVAVTDPAHGIPQGLDYLGIGQMPWGLSLNGTIKKLAYYPKRLSDAELQEMTL